jgi:hypothetical protein
MRNISRDFMLIRILSGYADQTRLHFSVIKTQDAKWNLMNASATYRQTLISCWIGGCDIRPDNLNVSLINVIKTGNKDSRKADLVQRPT